MKADVFDTALIRELLAAEYRAALQASGLTRDACVQHADTLGRVIFAAHKHEQRMVAELGADAFQAAMAWMSMALAGCYDAIAFFDTQPSGN